MVHALARRADVVMMSYRAGVAEKYGIDYATLSELNPDLVYLNAPGYGIDGPCGRYPNLWRTGVPIFPPGRCGLGSEWVLILPPLLWLRRRRYFLRP